MTRSKLVPRHSVNCKINYQRCFVEFYKTSRYIFIVNYVCYRFYQGDISVILLGEDALHGREISRIYDSYASRYLLLNDLFIQHVMAKMELKSTEFKRQN